MNYTTEIKQYISQLETPSENPAVIQEQTRIKNILTAFCENHMWGGVMKVWPNESDYDAFRSEIDNPDNPKFVTENVNSVKKFFAWVTLQMLETSKRYDDECMQCFTVLECADLGRNMNVVVAILKDIYSKILIGDKWTPESEEEKRTLIGYNACCGGRTENAGLDYLHTNDLNTVNIYDQDKASRSFFEWLKRLTTYSLSTSLYPNRGNFNFKEQYEYALSVIEERLSILKAKNPITVDIDARMTATPTMSESVQPDLFGAESAQSHEDVAFVSKIMTDNAQPVEECANTENSQASETEGMMLIEPEVRIEDKAEEFGANEGAEATKTLINEPELLPNETLAPVKKKLGRKRFDTVNGEKKSEKLMLYLTPELMSRIRIWCDLKGISNVSFITELIENFLNTKQETINEFLELRKRL